MARSSDNSGDWLTTYADFITLLLLFFVLLYSLTPGVEKNKFEAIIGAFQQNDGLMKYRSVTKMDPVDVKVKRAENWQNFQEHIEEENLTEQVQIDLMSDGVRITLGESIAFGTYSATLKPKAKEFLNKIGQNLHEYTSEDIEEIEISGHTDNRPIKEGARLFKTNWELGAARATSVLGYFINHTRIMDEYFKISSYGPYRPRTENDSEEGRRRNRRVEIYIRYEQPDKENPDEEQKAKPIPIDYGRRASK